jgi:hypothetical protein
MFLECESYNTRKEALNQIEDVIDRRTYLSDRFENVAVKNHLPLYTSLGGEKRARMNWKL